jgi:alkylhydroperoxidase family enzyme
VPRISVPADRDPLIHLWTERAVPLTSAAGALSDAVYRRSSLPLREFEAARARIAQINDCQLCLDWRTARDVPQRVESGEEAPPELYEKVGADPAWEGFSERERLAAEFAERFALDHRGMDDDLWRRLHAAFTDDELVDLAVCVGSWLAFGRLNRVLGLDTICKLPSHR